MVSHEVVTSILEHSPVDDSRALAESIVAEFDARLGELSDQQVEVMRMICSGMLNKEIARRLCVSIRGVEDRRRRIFDAFGVSNAAELSFDVGLAEAFRLLLSDSETSPSQKTPDDSAALSSIEWADANPR